MKICHVTRQFYPVIGGIEAVVWHLSQQSIALGHSVKVITLDRLFTDTKRTLPRSEVVEGIEIVRIPFKGPQRYAIAPSILTHIKDCDLVHLHSSDFFLDYLVLTKFKHRKPIVFSTHGLFFHTPYAQRIKKIYLKTITRLDLTQVEKIVCDSSQDEQLIRQIANQKKIVRIPNGIDFQTLTHFPNVDRDANLCLSVGRLVQNKRHDRSIHTFLEVVKKMPDAKLVIVGPDWGEFDTLKQLIASLNLESKVVLTGGISSEQLYDLLNRASIWLSASEYESFGVALLEAMAAGCIPVVQSLEAFSQLVDNNVSGFYTDYSDPEDASKTIIHAMNLTSVERARLQVCARQKAQAFDWHNITRKFLDTYLEILD